MNDIVLVQVFQPGCRIDELPTIDQYNRRTAVFHSLTRRMRLIFGWDLTKFMMFPFFICSETIETSGGVNTTPTNGRMLSCRSHFHPTTSLARSLGSGLSGCLVAYIWRLLTLCTFLGSAVPETLRVFIATGRPSNVALYTYEEPPESNGVASRSSNVGVSVNEDGRTAKVPHSFRKCFRYCFLFRLSRSPLSRVLERDQAILGNSNFSPN